MIATRCKFDFSWKSACRQRWGSSQLSPNPYLDLRVHTSEARKTKKKKGKGKGERRARNKR